MSLILNDEHKKILEATGHVLVTGGPGSGKTTIALQKAANYIQKNNLRPGQNVLFLSFSRAAVARINESADLEILDPLHQKLLSIQTFHSFFWEIIKTHGYLLGTPRRLRVLSPHDEESLRQGRNKNDKKWIEERNKIFSEKGRISFDLFASVALQILSESMAIRDICYKKFPLIIIDEAQDTDAEQWKCIQIFAPLCQMVLLADLDQQIHDYRADVTPERIADIIKALNPLQISLSGQNHRSSGVEIMDFARDLLDSTPRKTSYVGVSSLAYQPSATQRDQRIRQSIGIINEKLKSVSSKKPKSIAILATWGNGVKIISHALRETDKRQAIPHRVQFDETATFLSSRLIAYFLEPKNTDSESDNISQALNLICDLYRAKGIKKEWEKYERWNVSIKADPSSCRGNVVPEIKKIIQSIKDSGLSGNPEKDWLKVKDLLLSSTSNAIKGIGKNAEYLMAFNRGKRISNGLTRRWQETGSYYDARSVLDAAITETQIISENKNQHGINVMTIHKAKGKEFDAVIIFHNLHSSPFILRDDKSPFRRSRKLLFVGITRARHHTMILSDVSQKCPIIGDFNL